MSKHSLTFANEIFFGGAYDPAIFAAHERRGAPMTPLHKISLGSPIAADDDYIMDAAASTELPNAATKTYTAANDGSSPFDNTDTPAVVTLSTAHGTSVSVWPLDVPRALVASATHATSVVAMTITVTGYDAWGYKLVEQLSIAATGTSQTAAGKKSFKHIESIAVTSAGNATANTALNIGVGDVLGLPYALNDKADVLRVFHNGAIDDSYTAVVAVSTTPSATTGDVRGTIDPNSACDGNEIVVWMAIDPTNAVSLRGVSQYAG